MIAFSDRVRTALTSREPVVALESTVISHGLPFPENFKTAIECERLIEAEGAVPATVGIVAGVPRIGITNEELRTFADRKSVV